ncbi:MAG: prolyl oligopeptidase family serine peptidase [Hyphomicrobiaceae bacterium]
MRRLNSDGSVIRLLAAIIGGWGLSILAALTAVADGRVLTGQVMPSPALGRAIPYAVYLPQGATAARPSATPLASGRRWPVLYLLHGHGDNETAWLKLGGIAATLDRLIKTGKLQPLIVVMPMAGNSWYVDDARDDGYGPIFTALTSDMVRGVDARYPTLNCRAGRAIGGLSMGGFGAALAGVTHPDRFRAVISLSGSLFDPLRHEYHKRHRILARIYGGVFGEPISYERYRAWNVFTRLKAIPPSVPLPSFWLSAGDADFPSILRGTVRLHLTLGGRDAETELRVTGDGHDWRNWQRAITPALTWLATKLGKKCH